MMYKTTLKLLFFGTAPLSLLWGIVLERGREPVLILIAAIVSYIGLATMANRIVTGMAHARTPSQTNFSPLDSIRLTPRFERLNALARNIDRFPALAGNQIAEILQFFFIRDRFRALKLLQQHLVVPLSQHERKAIVSLLYISDHEAADKLLRHDVPAAGFFRSPLHERVGSDERTIRKESG